MTRIDLLFIFLLMLAFFFREHYLLSRQLEETRSNVSTSQRAAEELWATINRATE